MMKKGKTKRTGEIGQSPTPSSTYTTGGLPPGSPAPKTECVESSPMPPLTPTPEPVEPLTEAGRIECPPTSTTGAAAVSVNNDDQAGNHGPPEMLDQLKDFVNETHLCYDDLNNDLHVALEQQEKMFREQQAIAERIELIRRQAWASRLVFARNISTARELMAAGMEKASTNGEGEVFTAPRRTI